MPNFTDSMLWCRFTRHPMPGVCFFMYLQLWLIHIIHTGNYKITYVISISCYTFGYLWLVFLVLQWLILMESCDFVIAHIISHQLREETRMTSSLKALQIGTIEFDMPEVFFWDIVKKNWRTYQRGFEQNHHFGCTSCTLCRSFANAIAIPQWNDYNTMKSTIHMLQHMIEKQ